MIDSRSDVPLYTDVEAYTVRRTVDPSARGRGPLGVLLDLFSSVWFGIAILAVFFIYCAIGSAVPAVRELPGLELTEFEWFHWWPFNVLMALLGITLATVTIRRIPLRKINAGVWMIHTGIIILLIGSYIYFGTKVEGDAPVFRRHVRIELPGLATPRQLVVLPGNAARVVAGPDAWQFEIQNTNSNWPILSGDDKGKEAYAVNVLITRPDGSRFVRQLLDGFPQYTEDVLPGQGRAVKVTGKKLVDESLKLSLELEPQEHFHLMKTWSLFVRRVGEKEWIERPIPGMPRYHDRIASRDQIFSDHPVPLRAMDLDVPPQEQKDALADASVRVTGFLRYAQMKRRWRDGGGALNPVLRISAAGVQGGDQTYDLAAFDSEHNKVESGAVQFLWFDDPAAVETLPTDSRAMLTVAVPAAAKRFEVPLTPEVLVGRDGPLTAIEGTDFSYRILNVADDLAMPGGRRPVSVAMVEIQTPEGRFTRMVADQADATRDIHGDADPHNPGARKAEQIDQRIQMTYKPRSAPIMFVAHPAGLYLAVNGASGRLLGRAIAVGEPIEVVAGLTLRAESLWRQAVLEEKPYVVPPSARNRGVEENSAMIRLEVTTPQGAQTRWLSFNSYALPSQEYAYSGRLAYSPETFRLGDGSAVEVLFSRRRMQLPAPVAMEDFQLDTHLGGFSGSVSTIRNYVSRLRFQTAAGWTEPEPTAVNQPREHGGFWFFQSTWDPPSQENPTGGMNYTGLGVGNRHGVYVQLFGCCLSVAGMLFSFYVKPVLQRRRRAQAKAKVNGELRIANSEWTDESAHSEFTIRHSEFTRENVSG